MSASYVFGYGSLVNLGTHTYGDMHLAQLPGWRRVWRHAAGNKTAFLSVTPADGVVDGAILCVPEPDWPDLHERERSYLCEPIENVAHPLVADTSVSLFHAPHDLHPKAPYPLPILLSYLDVVVQGYFRALGAEGVGDFFMTTDGWEAPICDDRASPRYPRSQVLTLEERELTDLWLTKVGADVSRLPPQMKQ